MTDLKERAKQYLAQFDGKAVLQAFSITEPIYLAQKLVEALDVLEKIAETTDDVFGVEFPSTAAIMAQKFLESDAK